MRTLSAILLIATTTGCVILSGGVWQCDSALDAYRAQGCIDVISSDGRHTGLAQLPNTSVWHTVTLTNMAVKMSLPEGIQAFDSTNWVSVSLYKIFGHYRDSRWAVGIEVRKKTRAQKEEEDLRLQRIIKNSWGENDPRSVRTKWERLQFHSKTEHWQGLYRRDIRCPDGSFLFIRGTAEALTVKATGEDLHPGMVSVIRRVMDSVELLPSKGTETSSAAEKMKQDMRHP